MKTLADMGAEVEQLERDKGWYDMEISFGERMALLHSEVSEALEAYREWGLADATVFGWANKPAAPLAESMPPKPEGVGSEFADIFIRLLGDCRRDGVRLPSAILRFNGARFGLQERFAEQMQTLHLLIDKLYMCWEDGDEFSYTTVGASYAKVYVYLTQLCDLYGINLEAEYERKMTYNRTRPYRHGGKLL